MQQFHGPIYYGKHYEYMTLDSQEKIPTLSIHKQNS
jgi:hypothetical protein